MKIKLKIQYKSILICLYWIFNIKKYNYYKNSFYIILEFYFNKNRRIKNKNYKNIMRIYIFLNKKQKILK